jgi:hypothetical protein
MNARFIFSNEKQAGLIYLVNLNHGLSKGARRTDKA